MESVRLGDDNFKATVTRAAEVLRGGGVVLYPTDTLYGLGADAFSDAAFQKICEIKARDERRPIHAIVENMEMAETYAEITPLGRRLAEAFLPGPLTLVFKKKPSATTGIARNISTIGVRIPKNEFCIALAREFGKPYTTTSANVSGSEPPATFEGILEQLGGNTELIDLAIEGEALPSYLRSTVIDVRDDEPYVLREGAIATAEIMRAAQARP